MVYDETADATFDNSVFYELVKQKDSVPERVLERRLKVLLLTKMTDDDSFTRLAAFDWLRTLGQNVVYSRAWLRQGTSSIHVHAVQHVCREMSDQLKAVRCWVLAECGARVEQLRGRKHAHGVISAILGAALEGIKLTHSPEHGYSADTYIILSNLLWIMVQLEEAVEEHLQECIAALCGEGDRIVSNIQVLLRFLLDCNQHVQHQRMLDATHRLVAFVHRLHPDVFWTEACASLTPSSAISLAVKPFIHDEDAQYERAFIPDLRNLLAYGREEDNPVSAAALLLTFLALCGVTPNVSDKHRALVLHVASLNITSLWPPAQDAATSLLEDILEDQPACVRASVPADVLELAALPPAPPAAITGSPSISVESDASCALLAEWRRVALLWSTSVPVRAFACQSFVIFRQLNPPAEATSLAEILGRLSSSISDGSDDVSLFSIEALRTIMSMTQQLTLGEDSIAPGDFAVTCLWTCLASMTSINEAECAEAFSLLTVLLRKSAHLHGPSVANKILAQQPPDWDQGNPDWTLSILLSLHCSTTRRAAMGLTEQLLEMESLSHLYDDDRFLGLCFIAMLPYFVLSLEPERNTSSEEATVTANIAKVLATRFAAKGLSDLQRTCEAVANARFKIIDDLIRQGVNGARVHYVPQLMEPVVFLLFGSALAPEVDARTAALKVAKAFVETLGPAQTSLLAELSSDIWIPLLLALHTGDSSAQDALSCLNLTTRVSGGPNARQLLRMSSGMQWGYRSRTTANAGLVAANDDTPANRFFGPVSPTGWSVADAHEATVRTRSNLANTFRTCEQNLDIVPAAVHVNFVEAGDVSDGSLWNASESRARETTPCAGGSDESQEDELEGIVAQLHDLSNFFVAGALPTQQQLAPPSNYQGLSRNSSVHLSRSNTQNGRDPQKQVAKVLSRAAAYSGPALPHTQPHTHTHVHAHGSEPLNAPVTRSGTPIQDYVAANDSFALAMATGGAQDNMSMAQAQ